MLWRKVKQHNKNKTASHGSGFCYIESIDIVYRENNVEISIRKHSLSIKTFINWKCPALTVESERIFSLDYWI